MGIKKQLIISSDEEKLFRRFWSMYPLQHFSPTEPTKRVFVQVLRLGFRGDVLLEATRRYAQDCKNKKLSRKRIPSALQWLIKMEFKKYLTQTQSKTPLEVELDRVITADPHWPYFQAHMPWARYRAWIKKLNFLQSDDPDVVRVVCPSPFHRNFVEQNYRSEIGGCFPGKIIKFEVQL